MGCTSPPIPRSGRLGFVGDYTDEALTRYSRVRNWRYDGLATPEERVYSGTRYGTQRLNGFTEDTGSFQGWGAVPPLFVGDEFTFLGYTTPTDGVPCGPGCALIIPAIVTQLSIVWNWTAENKTVNWTVTFGQTGDLDVDPSFDDPCDDEVFCDDNICDLELDIFGACDDAELNFCNYTNLNLTFTMQEVRYSNNTTNCQIRKQVGTLDWRMEITEQNPCIIPVRQNDYWFRIDASTSTEWILKWGKFLGVQNLVVDTESNTVIEKTNVFAMQAVNCCVPGTPVRGSIITPTGDTVWPYTTAS